MKLTIHKSEARGVSHFKWLESYHSFSFGNYYNPSKTNFGVLRVLNDDTVDPGAGFGMHPHKDMEIISIPLQGALKHEDSMGNKGVITSDEVQVMSAGTGIRHSEMNESGERPVKFLQIWIFPNKNAVTPRYGQQKIEQQKNIWNLVVAPNSSKTDLWIHQDAYIFLSIFESGVSKTYELKDPNNGVYIFVIEGAVSILENELDARDGLGIEGVEALNFEFKKNTKLLLMEVPME